jgi:periplasmic copper chaperone A
VMTRSALVLLICWAGAVASVRAHDHGPSAIEIVQPWAPVMAAGQDTQFVYLTVRNRANLPDRLMRALSPVASKVELHGASADRGEPKPVAALTIGAGEELVLSATGPHLAMVGLKRSLLEHQTFKLALEFDVGGRIVVDVVVGPPAAAEPHRH